MKHVIIIIPAMLVTFAFLTSCEKKFDENERNPNRAVEVSPDLVFRGVTADMNTDGPWSLVSRWNQFDCCNYNYYGDQRYDWTEASLNYATLKNVIKMEEEAKRAGNPDINPYSAMGKFFRAFFFYRMTNLVGDLPMTEALKGLENPNPTYDSQKDVFMQILQWLEDSNSELAQLLLAGNKTLDGDIYFKNDLRHWQRTVNTFRLRVLISLGKKEADAMLNIKQQITGILNDNSKYPIMNGREDNLQYIYSVVNKYPSNPDNLGFDATRYNMSATYLNKLVELKDPRAFITSEPATKQLAAGKTPADITAYVGANPGEDLANMSSKMADAENGEYSVRSRSRYYSNYGGEPGIIIGFAEMCFNIAEAINRGWVVTGSAEDWYKKGIKASLEFYSVPTEAPGIISKVYMGNIFPVNFDFENNYYQQTAVKYKGNNVSGLEQILTQKYLAFFQNSGREAYYNWRRTNVPVFLTGTGTGNSGVIPKRYQYPSSERTTNGENWNTTLQNQFGGKDDINAEMWLIK